MTDELKPCWHCGGEVFINDYGCFECKKCGMVARMPMSKQEKANAENGLMIGNFDYEHNVKAWNTRAERTCKVLCDSRPNGAEGLGRFGICSECGGKIETVDQFSKRYEEPDVFCRKCGARVEA